MQWQVQMRAVIAIIVLAANVAGADPFKPPAQVPKAQEHFVRGKQLFEAKQYTDAAIEFAAAAELDPDAKFLLFNLGLARMAGSCKEAVECTQLDAGPPDAAKSAGRDRALRGVATLPSNPAAAGRRRRQRRRR